MWFYMFSKSKVTWPRVFVHQETHKAKQFLPFLQRAGRSEAVVEYVFSGSRLKLYMPKETCLITFLLAGRWSSLLLVCRSLPSLPSNQLTSVVSSEIRVWDLATYFLPWRCGDVAAPDVARPLLKHQGWHEACAHSDLTLPSLALCQFY